MADTLASKGLMITYMEKKKKEELNRKFDENKKKTKPWNIDGES